MPAKRLTPDERERIVELRLNRVPVAQVAAALPCSPTTVQKVWKAYLRQRVEDRRADLEIAFEDTIARLERNAADARRGYIRATADGEHKAAAGYLTAERQALAELAKLGAVRDDAPAQAARVAAGQAAALATVLRGVLTRAEVPETQRAVIMGQLAEQLRELDQ